MIDEHVAIRNLFLRYTVFVTSMIVQVVGERQIVAKIAPSGPLPWK